MTTTLTRAEARKALSEGKFVGHEDADGPICEDKYGHHHYVEDDDQIVDLSNLEHDGFYLVEKPHQNPTLEACLKARVLEIEWPEGVRASSQKYTSLDAGIWAGHQIAIIHAALSFPGAKVTILEG